MNKSFFLVTLFFISAIAMAQVGIETDNPGSSLEVNGSLGINYVQVTSSGTYALTNTDYYVSYEGTTNATFTLPNGISDGSATGCNCEGRTYEIINKSDKVITLNAATGQQIDNSSSLSIAAGFTLRVVNRNLASGSSYWTTVVYASSNVVTAEEGVLVKKLRLSPENINLEVVADDYTFRYKPDDLSWQIKTTAGDTRSYQAFFVEHWNLNGYGTFLGSGTYNGTFMGLGTLTIANEINVYRIFDEATGKIYRFEGVIINIGGVKHQSILVEVF